MPEPLRMSPRARPLALALGAIVLAVAGGTAIMLARRHTAAVPVPTLQATLEIEPFTSLAAVTGSWPSRAFADSLAARLSWTPGLSARVEGRGTNFILRGHVTTGDQRLVVATRLFRSGEATPLWTSTFWRREDSAFALVDDLAADVAEALYGYLARHAVDDNGRIR